MSRFLGRERNKGLVRRNIKALEYMKKIIANQNKPLVEEVKEIEKDIDPFKIHLEEKYGTEVTEDTKE